MTTLPHPPWAKGFNRWKFKAWLKAQLNASYEPSADDIWRETQSDPDPAFDSAVSRHVARQAKRGKVILAVQARDSRALERLTANDPELTSLVIRKLIHELTHKRKRGRQRGDPRPRDLIDIKRQLRFDALAELELIRHIICSHYDGHFKGSDEFAVEIVVERANRVLNANGRPVLNDDGTPALTGLTSEDLLNFRKNQKRHSAS